MHQTEKGLEQLLYEVSLIHMFTEADLYASYDRQTTRH